MPSNGEEYSFFTDGSSEEKLEYYDQLTEEEDEFIEEVIKKFTYLISFWYVSKVDNEEDFREMLKEQDLDVNLDTLEQALEASDRMDEAIKGDSEEETTESEEAEAKNQEKYYDDAPAFEEEKVEEIEEVEEVEPQTESELDESTDEN